MKKYFLLFAFLSYLLLIPNVSAKEYYFKNDNGVFFTKEEYDFLTYMFWNGSQDLMTLEDYDKFILSDIMNGELDSKTYVENSYARSTSVSSVGKNLKITKSCSNDCTISVTLTWTKDPAVRSYEVMGAYLKNTSLKSIPSTTILSHLGSTKSTEIKNFNNGFGVSIELPKYGNSLIVNQTFMVAKGGTVYASYQHATKVISLANSKNYTLSNTGYGRVFNFSGVAASTYDKMAGVDMSV